MDSQKATNVFECTEENIKLCAKNILEGNVVVFPTETVYGMGACALNDSAVEKIYNYKKRPINNPLIVHVIGWSEAEIYINPTQNERDIAKRLVDVFWPGPLTILVRKNEFISDLVTANSEFVGLRSPSNKHARKLLESCMVPIAAPSANISNKITSTSRDHIISYFGESSISLLVDSEPCELGTESTIVKVENETVTIMRPGMVTIDILEDVFKNMPNVKLCYKNNQNQTDSPGTSISHYTTTKNTVLFNFMDMEIDESSHTEDIENLLNNYLDKSACIDFGKRNIQYKDLFGAYVDLSKDGDVNEAIFNLYDVLHQLDKLDISNILIFDFYSNKDGLYQTIFDRMYRCCSGKKILIPLQIISTRKAF